MQAFSWMLVLWQQETLLIFFKESFYDRNSWKEVDRKA